MSTDLYRCVCHTCETEQLIDGLEDAQDFFNQHADRAHEVELFNHRTRTRATESTVDENGSTPEQESADEDYTSD